MIAQPKNHTWRSKAYESWVREQPCLGCGNPVSECHHIKGVGNFSGVGMKSSSLFTIPLCRDCHRAVHNNPIDHREDQLVWALKTIEKAINEGVLS